MFGSHSRGDFDIRGVIVTCAVYYALNYAEEEFLLRGFAKLVGSTLTFIFEHIEELQMRLFRNYS